MNVEVSNGGGRIEPLLKISQWMYKGFNGGGRIKPLLKIFYECRSLTGVGELNPYWRSSMNVEVERVWEN